jgi:competence protein ComEA
VNVSDKGAARIARGARRFVSQLTEHARNAAAWRWGGPLVRVALAALGLLVLAAIGRSALAGGASRDHASTIDPAAADSSSTAPVTFDTARIAVASAAPVPPVVPAPSSVDAGDAPSRGRATPDDPVYLNQAALGDLRRLPGVGPKRALAILALRDRLQRFRQIEDLLKVKGIGRASLRKLRPLVRLDTPPSATGADAMPPPPSPG